MKKYAIILINNCKHLFMYIDKHMYIHKEKYAPCGSLQKTQEKPKKSFFHVEWMILLWVSNINEDLHQPHKTLSWINITHSWISVAGPSRLIGRFSRLNSLCVENSYVLILFPDGYRALLHLKSQTNAEKSLLEGGRYQPVTVLYSSNLQSLVILSTYNSARSLEGTRKLFCHL